MKLIKFILLILLVEFTSLRTSAQFINNNTDIKVGSNAYVIGMGVDFIDNGTGTFTNDGTISLDGGNWLNNSTTKVFKNLNQEGLVSFTGDGIQTIGGTHITVFESLNIANGPKKLTLNEDTVENTLSLNTKGVLQLNKQTLILDNSSTESLTSDGTGYILSESINNKYSGTVHNDTVYGQLQWNIGSSTATGTVPYIVPFGDAAGDFIPLSVKVNSAGSPSTGNITFATYPSNNEDLPLPSIVNTTPKGLQAYEIANRYWKIQANYTSKPDVDIDFAYSSTDVSLEKGLSAMQLLAIRYNSNENTWLDIPAAGVPGSSANSVLDAGVKSYNLFDWWTLTAKSEIQTANVFTPNGDNVNEYFIPQINDTTSASTPNLEGLLNYDIKIFNRWGEIVYKWSGNVSGDYKGWDGKNINNGQKCTEGAYFYVITAKGSDGVSYNKHGSVTLIDKK